MVKFWFSNSKLAYALLPFSGIYRAAVSARRFMYRCGIKKTKQFNVPVIVVGNITVGGSGKSPLVAWLAQWLQSQHFKPGIVSRGYGGRAKQWPQVVTVDSDPRLVGDEPVMLARQTRCPIVVAPDRVDAVRNLLQTFGCDIVISDDGLQHYALVRDIEIAVVDGQRRYGNQYCLPAGPLREPVSRLKEVNFLVTNGEPQGSEFSMQLVPDKIYSIINPQQTVTVADIQQEQIHAVAGIGHPQRFFQQLRQLGLDIIEHPYPDHYRFQKNDIEFNDDKMVIMTEKDAVKCLQFADKRHWCLPVRAKMDEKFVKSLRIDLLKFSEGRKGS